METYQSIKGMMAFLKTEVEVKQGEVEQKSNGRVLKTKPGYIVKTTVSNIAPVETTWPMIIFSGVNLVSNSVEIRRGAQAWVDQNHFKVDFTKAPQQNAKLPVTLFLEQMKPLAGSTDAYPAVTSDEVKHGYFLFPGQSLVFEIGVNTENQPDVKDLGFWVQGSLSWRHLFHTLTQVT